MSQLSGYDVLPGEAWEEEDGAALETARQTSLHRRMYPQDGNLNDAAIAGVIGVVLTGLFAMATPAVLHWFLLPVWICGMLIGKDGVAWVRGKMDIFDVKGMVGIVGYHFFFLSPVLWIFYEGQPKEMPIPEDWRTWFGLMGVINLVCLVLYLVAQRKGFSGVPKSAERQWLPPATPLPFWVVFGLVVSVVSFIIWYVQVGGFAGMAYAREKRAVLETLGLGPLTVLAGTGAPLAMIAMTLMRGAHNWWRSTSAIVVILLTVFMFAVQILTSGVSGSRSALVWTLVWLVAVVHYFWRPIKRWQVAVGLVVLAMFLQFYVLYKDYGADALKLIRGSVTAEALRESHGRTVRGLASFLLGDTARTEVQASLLFTLSTMEAEQRYDLRLGRTYLFYPIRLVPYWIWSYEYKPWSWSKAATSVDWAMGKGTYEPFITRGNPVVRQYGLGGEAMLNFGIIGPFMMYPLWGFLMGRMRRKLAFYPSGDMRLLIAPYLVVMLLVALPSDSDNVYVVFVFRALFPSLAVWLISLRSSVEQPAEEAVPEPT